MPRTITAPPPRGSIIFSNRSWGMLMKLAYDSGWKPLGCQQPADWPPLTSHGDINSFYSMDYFSRNGQVVTDPDAMAIADALEGALPDVPRFDAMGNKILSRIDIPGMDRPMRSIRPGVKVNPYEYFSGENRAVLEGVVRFMRGGGFSIT